MSETLFIRADANEIVGTGHVMRCLSIADQVREIGGDVVFVTADEKAVPMVTERGYETLVLGSRWDALDSELDAFLSLIEERGIRSLLVDSYYVTENYLRRLSEVAEVTYLDDLNRFSYPVQRVINYNFYGPETTYPAGETEYLLGTEYAPLRPEFSNVPERAFGALRKILITTGGTDAYGVAEKLLARLTAEKAFDECELFCVLGRFHSAKEELLAKYAGNERVHILVNIPNMMEYMCACDAAVLAGGTTTYEICACGLPGVVYTLADNQFDNARSAGRLGILPWAGDVREDMEGFLNRTVEELLKLEDAIYRREISARMQKMVDGSGAVRIAEKLLKEQ